MGTWVQSVSKCQTHFQRNVYGRAMQTCGVPWVDDAEHLGVTVVFGLLYGPPEFIHIQGPAVLLVQVVIHLNSVEL